MQCEELKEAYPDYQVLGGICSICGDSAALFLCAGVLEVCGDVKVREAVGGEVAFETLLVEFLGGGVLEEEGCAVYGLLADEEIARGEGGLYRGKRG